MQFQVSLRNTHHVTFGMWALIAISAVVPSPNHFSRVADRVRADAACVSKQENKLLQLGHGSVPLTTPSSIGEQNALPSVKRQKKKKRAN